MAAKFEGYNIRRVLEGVQSSRIMGEKDSWFERGTRRHFVGAMRAGKERTPRCLSSGRGQ